MLHPSFKPMIYVTSSFNTDVATPKHHKVLWQQTRLIFRQDIFILWEIIISRLRWIILTILWWMRRKTSNIYDLHLRKVYWGLFARWGRRWFILTYWMTLQNTHNVNVHTYIFLIANINIANRNKGFLPHDSHSPSMIWSRYHIVTKMEGKQHTIIK